jgi:NADH dehydrogenase (ubiquinone) 1 beta subcomplex subunit 8
MWGPDAPVVPPRRALFEFTFAWAIFGGIAALCWAFMPERPAIAREYPFNGLENELGGNKVCLYSALVY